MKTYLDLLDHVLTGGVEKSDRTGTGTLSSFGYQMRFRPASRFSAADNQEAAHPVDHRRVVVVHPGLDQRQMAPRAGVTIWDEWADADGELGPIYGYQWRSWPSPDGGHIDQLAGVINSIKRFPIRAGIVSAWNVGDLADMALPPCHAISSSMSRRAGCPASSTSAQLTSSSASRSTSPRTPAHPHGRPGLRPGDRRLRAHLGDAHLYLNHLDQARLQLTREPRPLPRLSSTPGSARSTTSLSSDIAIEGYDPSGHQSADRRLIMPEIIAIAAVAANGVIGAGNDIPWRIPADWQRFKALTMGTC